MRKIVLYTAVTIDGFIAAEGDNLDWLMTYKNTDDSAKIYNELYNRIDTAIMGHGTYKFVVDAGVPDPYPDKKTIVFSRSKHKDTDRITYVTGDIIGYTKSLLKEEGKDIWLVGGGAVNNIFLEQGLIDELQLTIAPVTLGSGTRLFEGQSTLNKFDIKDCVTLDNGMTHMTYTYKNN